MQTLANPFTPQTPIGAGLQNIATALFAGRMGAQQNSGVAEERAARTGLLDAQRRAVEAKMSEAAAANARLTTAPARLGEAIFGSAPRAQEFMDFRAGRQVLPEFAMAHGEDDVPIPTVAAPRPAFATPDLEQRFNRGNEALALLSGVGGGDQAGALDNLLRTLFQQDQVGGMLAGTTKPTDVLPANFAAGVTGNKPFSATGNVGTMNNATGTQDINAIGTSMIAENVADALLTQARTVTEGAKPGLVRAQTRAAGARADRTATAAGGSGGQGLIPIEIETRNGPVVVNLTPAQAAQHARGTVDRPPPAPPTPPRPAADFTPSPSAVQDMARRIKTGAPGIENALSDEVLARAIDLMKTQGSPTFRNPVSSVQQALFDMTETKSGIFRSSTVRKKPAQTIGAATAAQALPQVAGPAQPGQSLTVTGPPSVAPSRPAQPGRLRFDENGNPI